MTSTSIGYASTAQTLAILSQQRVTGELTLANDEYQWKLCFFHGRLVYATGSLHRVRRWHRAIKRHCPNFKAADLPDLANSDLWEYQLLSHAVTQGQISAAQAQEVIKSSLEEVLFSWVSNPALTSDWSTTQRFSLRDNTALSLLLSFPQVDWVLQQSLQVWKHWKALELGALNPYKSPVLRQSAAIESTGGTSLPNNLTPFLGGRHTLWDIAGYAKKPVTTVTRFLLPWVQRGAIALEEVPDLPNPLEHRLGSTSGKKSSRPLIACIDDSPTVGHVLSTILLPAGYRLLTIQEPMSGIGMLNKHRPDLIFMDLIMPDTDGYNLCTFLRKTPAFKNTPIIILTSQNGIVDRTRAKLAGATDFLTKPPEPAAMLSLVRNHLRAVMPPTYTGGSEEVN